MSERRREPAVAVFLSGCGALTALLLVAVDRSELGLAVGLGVLGAFGLAAGRRRRRAAPRLTAGERGRTDMARIDERPRLTAPGGAHAPEGADTPPGAAPLAPAPPPEVTLDGRDDAAAPRAAGGSVGVDGPSPPDGAPGDAEVERVDAAPSFDALEVAEPAPSAGAEHAVVIVHEAEASSSQRRELDDLFAGSTRTFRALQQRLRGAGVKVSPSTLEIDEAGRVRGIAWQASLGGGDGPRLTLPLVSIAALGDVEPGPERGAGVSPGPAGVRPAPAPRGLGGADPFAAFRGRPDRSSGGGGDDDGA